MLPMWPALPGFIIESIELNNEEYVVGARSLTTETSCPQCQAQTTAAHSWYQRAPQDLPSTGIVVRLVLHVRKFFCRHIDCPQRVFCERLPQLVEKYARRTQRLVDSLTLLAMALGGQVGARLLPLLGMPASRDTLLRLIRKRPEELLPDPRVIGVDDWAFRKGQRYGTLICDLERREVIDLLPDREAETLATWLQAHPTVEMVTRDRSPANKAGITVGAPTAVQIADRWHLASNLVDALEATLAQQPYCLWGDTIQEKPAAPARDQEPEKTDYQTVKMQAAAVREAKRQRRQEQYEQILVLRQEGVTIPDIAVQVGLGQRTVERWLAGGFAAERKPRSVFGSSLDSYRTYIKQRWHEGCHNLAEIFREIQQQGYPGTYSTLYKQFGYLRRQTAAETADNDTGRPAPRRRYTPRQAAFLFIEDPAELTAEKKADLAILLTDNPQFQSWRDLAQQFMTLLRERNRAGLDPWLTAVAAQGSGPLKRFAAGLRTDYEEVAAALTYHWSNGTSEGFVNKLKLIKRLMYGRANLDLLRKRVLYSV